MSANDWFARLKEVEAAMAAEKAAANKPPDPDVQKPAGNGLGHTALIDQNEVEEINLNGGESSIKSGAAPAHRWGAAPEDWHHFSETLGLTRDLMPVVSNLKAEIDEKMSDLKEVGKVPSKYNRRGKVVGLPGWTTKGANAKYIQACSANPDYGICIQTRLVRAIDVDIEDTELASRVEEVIKKHFPTAPRRDRGNSKFLVAVIVPGDFKKRVIKTRIKTETEKGEMIEFLANGQQFIAAGTHPKGQRYRWRDGLPVFPTVTPEQYEACFAELQETFGVEPPVVARVKAPRTPVGVGATGTATDDPARAAADPVAAHLEATGRVRERGRNGELHITCPFAGDHSRDTGPTSTTYFPAGTGGFHDGHFKCLHSHCADRSDDEFLDAIGFEGYVDAPNDEGFEEIIPDPTARPKFASVPYEELMATSRQSWFIKGVLPVGELAMFYGESGSGKSFILLDVALAIARGVPWRGYRVKQKRVTYICAEGRTGLRNRLKAYEDHFGVQIPADYFRAIVDVPNLLREDDIALAKQIIAEGGTDLLIVDTLAQVTPGGDENSAEDMGRALAHCRRLAAATGAMVALVHHAGKDLSKGARGWSGIRAACDGEFQIETGTDGVRLLTVSKLKDGQMGAKFPFSLTSVVLGQDEDGDPIQSCVVDHGAVLPVKITGGGKQLVYEVVQELALFGDSASEVDVIKTAAGRMEKTVADEKRDQRAARAGKSLRALILEGLLKSAGGVVSLKKEAA